MKLFFHSLTIMLLLVIQSGVAQVVYTMTSDGGISGGTINRLDVCTNAWTIEYEFDTQNGDGHRPNGSLLKGSNGNLYGMTEYGGLNGKGTVFEFDVQSQTIVNQVDLTGLFLPHRGSFPKGSLIEVNGLIYGLTYQGGNNDAGVLFELDPSTFSYTPLHIFHGLTGGLPIGSLIHVNGKLYGVTSALGFNKHGLANGVLFEYDLDPMNSSPYQVLQVLNLNFMYTGGDVHGSLTFDGNDTFYGLFHLGSSQGNVPNTGGIFKYTIGIPGSYAIIQDLGSGNGIQPKGDLVLKNDKLYGYASRQGANWNGTLFVYDLNATTNPLTVLHHFDDLNGDGDLALGTPYIAPNDVLYGMTYRGGSTPGSAGLGTVFTFDLNSQNFNVIHDFTQNGDGASPIYSTFTYYCTQPKIINQPVGGNCVSGLSVTATGPNLSYDWYKQGGIWQASGQNFTPEYDGNYYVVVSNSCSSVTSNTVWVTVEPVITFLSKGGNCVDMLTVNATGTGLSFNWFKGSGINPVHTGQTFYPFTNGTYYVEVSNHCAVVQSVDITITTPPTISLNHLRHETGVNCNDGQISISASGGSGPLYAYQWFDENMNPISGATGPVISNLAPGTYVVEVDDGSCIEYATYVINPGVGSCIHDDQREGQFSNSSDLMTTEIRVYPNPANQELTIWSRGAEITSFKMIDVRGKVIQTHQIQKKTEFSHDVSLIPSGTYFLELFLLDGTREVKRISIQH